MKLSLAVAGCALAAALVGCDFGGDSADNATKAGIKPEETVWSGYAKDLQKAKQVEETLKTAKERLDTRIENTARQ